MESERIVLFLLYMLFSGTSAWLAYTWKMLLMASIPFDNIVCAIAVHRHDTVFTMSTRWIYTTYSIYSSISRFSWLGITKRWMVLVSIPNDEEITQFFSASIGIKHGSSNISSTHFQHFLSPSPPPPSSSTFRTFVNDSKCTSVRMSVWILFLLFDAFTIAHILFRELNLPQSVR